MKKILLSCAVLLSALASWAGTAPAGTEIYTTDGYKAVVLDDGSVAITWIYNSGEVTVPAEVTDKAEESTGSYKVTAVGNSGQVCGNDNAITKLSLSEGITSIGQSAFWGISTITSLSLPSTLASIGGWAFTNATGLTEIRSAVTTAPTLGTDVFKTEVDGKDWDYIGQHCAVYVPQGAAKQYKGTSTWNYWDSFWYVLEPAMVEISKYGYATYYNFYGYTMPGGVTGKVVVKNENGNITLKDAFSAGEEVSKETALILKGEPNAKYTFDLLPFATATAPANNLLKGVAADGYTPEETDGSYYYYKLTYGNSNGLGFYWGATDGGVFMIDANRCYLPLPQSEAGTAQYIPLEPVETAIGAVAANDNGLVDEVYTLSGVKVNEPVANIPKGIYIINGKKVVK